MTPDTRVEDVKRLASIRSVGCRKRSQEHAISHQRWSWWARCLSIATAAVAGLGGIGAISSAEFGTPFAVVGGILVVIGVLARALDEGLGASRTSEAHRLAAVRFREVQVEYLFLKRFAPQDPDAAEKRLAEIQAKGLEAESESPLAEDKSREKREAREQSEEVEKRKREEEEAIAG